MKRFVLTILLVCLAALVWGTGTQEKGPVTLNVWMKKQFAPQQNVDFEAKVKEFAAAKGINVNVEIIAYEDFFPKWTAALASKNLPDLSFFGDAEIQQFAQQGVMEDLSALLAEIQAQNGKMFPSSISIVTIGGKSYGIPFWGEGTALYWRRDYFNAVGLNNAPDTWEDFRTAAIKTTRASDNVYGAGIGYGSGNSDAEWLSRSIVWSHGGSVFDPTGKKIVFNSPETLKAVNFIAGLFLKDKVTPPTAMGWDDGGNNTAYISGQAAMVVNTGSILNVLRKNQSDILPSTEIAVLPKGPVDRSILGLVNFMGIFKDAAQKELGKELLKYLMKPDWYTKWIDVGMPLALPVYEATLDSDPIWQDRQNKAFLDSMKYFKFLGYKGPITPAAGKIANLRMVNAMFDNIIVKGMKPEDAIADFVKQAEKILAE
jgi:multiple sugar transport system substrate-binding protein